MSPIMVKLHSEIEELGEKIRDENNFLEYAETKEERHAQRRYIKKLEKRKELKERLYNDLL